jgi:hypothetical protein
VAELVTHKGEVVYYPKVDRKGNLLLKDGRQQPDVRRPLVVYKPSDILLMFLLRALRPALYRENVTRRNTAPDDIAERLRAGRERVAAARRAAEADGQQPPPCYLDLPS